MSKEAKHLLGPNSEPYRFGLVLDKVKDPRTIQMEDIVDRAVATVCPRQINWILAILFLGMMLNNKLGDCTVAGIGHLIQEWTANDDPKKERVISDEEIERFYRAISPNDTGASLLDALKHWRKYGIGTNPVDKEDAYAEVNLKDIAMVVASIYHFGGTYIGLLLPEYCAKPPKGQSVLDIPWEVRTGTGTAPNRKYGHCVVLGGYDQDKKVIDCITWGHRKSMSEDFLKKYGVQGFAVLSEQDWLGQDGRSPSGLDKKALRKKLKEIAQMNA